MSPEFASPTNVKFALVDNDSPNCRVTFNSGITTCNNPEIAGFIFNVCEHEHMHNKQPVCAEHLIEAREHSAENPFFCIPCWTFDKHHCPVRLDIEEV